MLAAGIWLLATAPAAQDTIDQEPIGSDSVYRSNYGDLAAYIGQPEKPIWFFIDSLEQVATRAEKSAVGNPKYRITTSDTLIGLLAGFEVSRVDYSLVLPGQRPVPDMHQGTLLVMHIWPGLYKLIAAYSGSDAPDSSSIVFLGDLESLGNFWYDDDRTEIDWAQYWTWDWPTESPRNLRFTQITSAALDSALPPGYYARYAGLMDGDSLSLTAPVYRPTDDFGKPTGGEVTVGYALEGNLLRVISCQYRAPKK